MPADTKQVPWWNQVRAWLTNSQPDDDEMDLAAPFFRTENADLWVSRLARLEWVAGLVGSWYLLNALSGWRGLPAKHVLSSWVAACQLLLVCAWAFWTLQRSLHTARIKQAGQFGRLNGPRSLSGLYWLGPLTVILTGGWTSPALLLLSIVVTHHAEYPRILRRRILILLGLTAFATMLPWYGGLLNGFTWNKVWEHHVLAAAVVTYLPFVLVITHSLWFVERVRPPMTVLMPGATSSFGYDPDHSNLYLSLLVRAMKLYRADGSMLVFARTKEAPLEFEARHAVNWPRVSELLSGAGTNTQRGVLVAQQGLETAWLAPHLEEALNLRTSRCGTIPANPAGFTSCIIFRIGPQMERLEQPFFVLSSTRKSAFRSPITRLTGIFWSQALQMMESAFLEAAWRRVNRAGDTRENLEKSLTVECGNFVPLSLRPLRVVTALRRKAETAYYLRPEQQQSLGADSLVSACTISLEGNHSQQLADIYVLADYPGKLLTTGTSALSRSRTLINDFLADVFRSPALANVLRRDAKIDESRDGWALLEISHEDEKRLKAQHRLPAEKDKYDKEFNDYGFRILATNAIMKAWMPWLQDEKGAGHDSPKICWKSYLRGAPQFSACYHCPIIRTLHHFFHPQLGQSAEPAPAPAMIGGAREEERITRHFYLSCELLTDPLDEKQIRNVVEHVEDRTVYFEKNRLARYLQSQSAAQDVLDDHSRLFQPLAEGLGRIFHASTIQVVSLEPSSFGKILHSYAGPGLDMHIKEHQVHQKLRKAATPREYLEVMDELPQLYPPCPCMPAELERGVMVNISGMVIESRTQRTASECTVKNEGQWLKHLGPEVRRLLVLEIPFSDLALLICTKEPQAWEYEQWNEASGVLRTRSAEFDAAFEMAENVGAKLRSSDKNYLSHVKNIRAFINHEMLHVTAELERTGELLRSFDLQKLKAMSHVFQLSPVQKEELPLWEWLAHVQHLSEHESPVARKNIDQVYDDFRSALGDRRCVTILDPMIRIGLTPAGLRECAHLRALPTEDRQGVSALLRSYYDMLSAIEKLRYAKRYTDMIFYGGWSPTENKRVNVRSLVTDALKTLRLAEHVDLEVRVEAGITTSLNENVLAPLALNLIRNAIDAANRLEKPARVVVACSTTPSIDWPFIQIANDGYEMKGEVLANLFLRPTVQDAPLGSAGSGTGLPAASHLALVLRGWLKYEFKEAFGSHEKMHLFTLLPVSMKTLPSI